MTDHVILLAWLINPLLLGIGGVLVLVPIIIHLLNKRKFKIIDWAAMDFLFDADKRNRRRVRLENLILLLLRCLAVLLIGLLLARPYISRGKISGFLKTTQYERIVLLDDSLSMTVQTGNQSSIERAKQSLIELANGLKENDSDDLLTLVLTSSPDERLINAQRVTEETILDIIETIEEIEASDRVADLPTSLEELERHVASADKNVNTVVYVFSDLRERDWTADGRVAAENSPAGMVKRLGEQARACFLVDVGSSEQQNLAITEIKPQERLVAGMRKRFDVTVKNLGDRIVRNARVKFTVGDSLPQDEALEPIAPGGSQTVSFHQLFQLEDFAPADIGGAMDDLSLARPPTRSYQIKAEIVTDATEAVDRLAADSARYFAANVRGGNSVLIVDGDPSAVASAAESNYLRRALRPFRDDWTGMVVSVINDAQLENTTLDDFDVVFLCNVYGLSQGTITTLERWVDQGGGLIIFPGDQLLGLEEQYNRGLFKDGEGLSPVMLLGVEGDEFEQTWATVHAGGEWAIRVLDVAEDGQFNEKSVPVHIDGTTHHPVFKAFYEPDNLILGNVKIFRWFKAVPRLDQLGKNVKIDAVLDSESGQWPAVTEKRFGNGRVVAFATAADDDWHNWTERPTWIPLAHTLVEYLSNQQTVNDDILVGEDVLLPVNLTEFKIDAQLVTPDSSELSVQAVPRRQTEMNDAGKATRRDSDSPPQLKPGDTPSGQGKKDVIYQVEHKAERSGMYSLNLTQIDGRRDQRLFAVNVDADEGRLTRLDTDAFGRQFKDDKIKVIDGGEAVSQAIKGAQIEIWPWVLLLVGVVLCTEQLLGWVFGRRR